MKTGEELATEYAEREASANEKLTLEPFGIEELKTYAYHDFLAGYNAREQWISVKDKLPEYTESLKIWDDERGYAVPYGKKCKAFVLAYNEEIGIFKAEYWAGKWSEISSISSRAVTVTHWKELPSAPKPSHENGERD